MPQCVPTLDIADAVVNATSDLLHVVLEDGPPNQPMGKPLPSGGHVDFPDECPFFGWHETWAELPLEVRRAIETVGTALHDHILEQTKRSITSAR